MDLFQTSYCNLPGYPAAWSPCSKYRYTLWRTFTSNPPRNYMALIGLNPSTATESVDDPTVNRCWKLAVREGFDAFCMLNLFGWRDTDPSGLYRTEDPVGADSDEWLLKVTAGASLIVAAWGTHGAYIGRGEEVKRMIPNLKCLGTTKDGHPRHPLYLRKDVQIIPFP